MVYQGFTIVYYVVFIRVTPLGFRTDFVKIIGNDDKYYIFNLLKISAISEDEHCRIFE